MDNHKKQFKKKIAFSILLMLFFITVFSFVALPGVFAQDSHSPQKTADELKAGYAPFALVGAAIAFGFGAIGAGIAIAGVGAAAMGAIGEKPEIASQALIFIALAEGLVVFGFITALMILGKM